MRGLRSDKVFYFQPGWAIFLLRMLLANAAMVLFLIYFVGEWQEWLEWTITDQVSRLAILVVGGMATYGLVLFAFGLRWRHIYR